MNKYGIVFGAAAVAVIAGCKDPDYKSPKAATSQNDVKQVETEVRVDNPPPVVIEPVVVKHCTCAPGTVHDKACMCGAPDCKCVVAKKPVIVVAPPPPVVLPPAPVEPESTTYIVQRGDYLAKISKKFNVTISSIKRLNPSIGEKNVVRVGQRLKLPGKVDVGVQPEPAKALVKAPAKKPYAPYSGATKEYVVKNGDTLGGVAYSNGINIRQLKELNGLQKDTLRVGQKLKIPAEKVVSAKAAPVAAVKKAEVVKPAKPVAEPVAPPAAPAPAAGESDKPIDATAVADEVSGGTAAAPEAPAETPAAEAPASAAAVPTTTYVVQEGDDMTGVSIRWGVSAAEIRELNNLGEKDQLVPGQIIKLPADAQQ